MAANVTTVPLQDAVIRVKNLRLQEDYEVEEEETQLFLVADSIQVTISGAKKFVTSADDYDEVDDQSASVIADDSGQPFTVDTGMLIIKVPAGAVVSVGGQNLKVTEEVQIDIFEDEDDDADESKQRDIVVTRSTGADSLKGHVTLQLQEDAPEVTVQCADGDSEVTIRAAEPVIFEDAPEDEAEAYSSDNDDDQFYNEQLREKNRLTNLWTEKEKVFRAEMEQTRREDEEKRRFKSRAPLVSSIFSQDASIKMLVKLLL